MELTPILALWGTVISTIALTWNILRGIQERKKIEVEANIGFFLPGDAERKVFYVTMTNVGRRPVFITGWGALRKKKKSEKGKPGIFITARNLPKMLKESEYNIEYTEDLTVFERNITRVQVWDSTGKKWKISRKNLKRLLKDASELLQQS